MTHNFSHRQSNYSEDELVNKINQLKNRISCTENLASNFSKNQLLDLIERIKESDLGKFLLINNGIDGYWTDYILNTPREQIVNLPWIDQVIINSRAFTASYERQQIFKIEAQKVVEENRHLASIPSGMMSELLDLDYSGINNIEITALDLDKQSFIYSKQKYQDLYNKYTINNICMNALDLSVYDKFDLITSNGLTIYMSDHSLIQSLYNKFYLALKPGGKLITSFLTYPKEHKVEQVTDIDKHQLELAVFVDILQVKWTSLFNAHEIKNMLLQAGFVKLQILSDKYNIFPTIIGYKHKAVEV